MKLRIRDRLILLVVLAILGPILASGLWNYLHTTRLLLEAASRDIGVALSETAGELDNVLGQVENDLLTVSQFPALRDLVDSQRYGLKEEADQLARQLALFLAEFRRRTERYRSIAFLDGSGRLLVRDGDPAGHGPLSGSDSKVASEPVRLREHGDTVCASSSVRTKDGQLLGSLVYVLELQKVLRPVAKTHFRNVGVPFLLGRSDNILYHPDPAVIGQQVRAQTGAGSGLEQIARARLARASHWHQVQEVDDWTIAARALGRAPWIVGLAVERDAIIASERAIGQRMLMVIGLTLLVAITVFSAVARRITDSVGKLMEGAQALGSGDLSARVHVQSNDELMDLGAIFNGMASGLQERDLEIRRYIDDLRTTQGQLVQAEKLSAVGQLAAGIAHEINNPLSGILLSARIVQKVGGTIPSAGTELMLKHCGNIASNVARAQEIIRSLLDYSRKSAEVMQFSPLDPNPLLEKTIPLVSHELKQRQFLARLESTGTMLADPNRLQQVVVNLLVNAVHATVRNGSVLLETANDVFTQEDLKTRAYAPRRRTDTNGGAYEDARRVASTFPDPELRNVAVGQPALRISVIDDGAGIAPENLSRIFDPFFTTKPAGQGTGLGLSIVVGIVAALNGTIQVVSSPGKGTTMSLKFPRI